MTSVWFSTGKDQSKGWRLDIVSLLAVIGESAMEAHSQAMTSSWTCMLPRIIPAPQALLKPSRPTRMPQAPSMVVGVHNGTSVQGLNYFPNIIHPIETLPAFAFRVYEIKHRGEVAAPSPLQTVTDTSTLKEISTSENIEFGKLESYPDPGVPARRSQTSLQRLKDSLSPKPHIPTQTLSPLNILAVFSCFLTASLLVWAIFNKDGTACLALGTISLASSIVGFASWWSPVLKKRTFQSKVPDGDVAIRTREGAFVLVKCNENVARELYTGTEECEYYVSTHYYRVLVGFGTFLLMVSVVLLGNCNFAMQAAIGSSYIVLNGAFWITSLMNKKRFWNLSLYDWKDITPDDAREAHEDRDGTSGGRASFTRTLWYAIRETKKIGWVRKSGAAPSTPEWDKWLKAAEENAGNRYWNAVQRREEIVGLLADSVQRTRSTTMSVDNAEQHAPAIEVPLPRTR